MEERIYCTCVTVSLKGIDEQLYFRYYADDGRLTFDNSKEEALEDVLSFMSSALAKKGRKELHFDVLPVEHLVFSDNFSVRRLYVHESTYPNCAWFDLDSFKALSLEDIAKFMKEYFESDCSKEFNFIAFLPTKAHYGYIFDRDSIMKLPVEEIKNLLLTTNLSDYMC